MSPWPEDGGEAIERHVRSLRLRNRSTVRVYRCILRGFQRFAQTQGCCAAVSETTVQSWVRDRSAHWPRHLVIHRARIVDRLLDFLAFEGTIPNNPFAELRARYGLRTGTPIVRALLAADPAQALEALRPPPRFGSFLGATMRAHVELMRALGHRYESPARRLLRFDRFLQGRPDLLGQPLPTLLRQWAAQCRTLNEAWQCELVGRQLARALRRIDPNVEVPAPERCLARLVRQQYRPAHVYTPQELRSLLEAARTFPSPRAPLRPLTLYTTLVLASCAGLRVGELARLDLGDVRLDAGELDIRQTKFFKSRTLPLATSVVLALREYVEARRRAGAPQQARSAFFWHERAAGRYSSAVLGLLLANVLRHAGLKPAQGRNGPRVHHLRHAFVLYRMLTWYRQGINPQARLPYLATYLGHKDINSTLVYLTVTQELLQHASERFRTFAAPSLRRLAGDSQ